MGKNKLAWILVVIFMTCVGYGAKLCLADESKDSLEIMMSIKNFLKGYTSGDLDSAMQEVSLNYLEKQKDGDVDYAMFKSRIEKIMANIYKQYNNYVIVDVSLLNLNIQSDNADVEVEFSWQATDKNTFEKKEGKKKKTFGFTKEKDVWKIVRSERANTS